MSIFLLTFFHASLAAAPQCSMPNSVWLNTNNNVNPCALYSTLLTESGANIKDVPDLAQTQPEATDGTGLPLPGTANGMACASETYQIASACLYCQSTSLTRRLPPSWPLWLQDNGCSAITTFPDNLLAEAPAWSRISMDLAGDNSTFSILRCQAAVAAAGGWQASYSPTSVVLGPTAPATQSISINSALFTDAANAQAGPASKIGTGALVGIAAGGAVLLTALAVLSCVFMKRKRHLAEKNGLRLYSPESSPIRVDPANHHLRATSPIEHKRNSDVSFGHGQEIGLTTVSDMQDNFNPETLRNSQSRLDSLYVPQARHTYMSDRSSTQSGFSVRPYESPSSITGHDQPSSPIISKIPTPPPISPLMDQRASTFTTSLENPYEDLDVESASDRGRSLYQGFPSILGTLTSATSSVYHHQPAPVLSLYAPSTLAPSIASSDEHFRFTSDIAIPPIPRQSVAASSFRGDSFIDPLSRPDSTID